MRSAKSSGRDRGVPLDGAGFYVRSLTDDDVVRLQLKVTSIVMDDPRLVDDRERRRVVADVLRALGLVRRVDGWHPYAGTVFGYWWHLHRDHTPCQPCWNARLDELNRRWVEECPAIPT